MTLAETYYDAKQKIWYGPEKEPFYDCDCSLGNVIFNFWKLYPKNICQISDIDGSIVTSEEVLNWCIQVATYLKKQGYNHKDIVGIAAGSSNYLVAAVVGCFFNGTPFHAINPTHHQSTLKTLFDLTKPKIIFCDGGDYEKIRGASEEFKPKIFTLWDHIDGVPKITDLLQKTGQEQFYIPERCAPGGDQTVAILCSSGTTGLPKAVCMNRDMILTHSHILNSEDVVYSPSGMDWVSGILMFIWAIVGGCKRVTSNKRCTPEHFAHLVKTYKITVTNNAPHHMALILADPSAAKVENFESIRFMSCGGGAISVSTLKKMQALLKNGLVVFGYGMSEVGTATLNFGITAPSGNCVGKLLPDFRVRIVDESGNSLGPNEVGEILINTGRKWPGYYNNPVATKRIQDEDGWVHSGDLGYFNDKNLLFVVDRIKDICKYRGIHYWLSEIEDVIMELEDVVDVCVLSVYDECDGDCAGAVVIKKVGSKLTEKDITDHVANNLVGNYQQLHGGVAFVNELPQNSNGKKLRSEARVFLIKAGR